MDCGSRNSDYSFSVDILYLVCIKKNLNEKKIISLPGGSLSTTERMNWQNVALSDNYSYCGIKNRNSVIESDLLWSKNWKVGFLGDFIDNSFN